MKTNLLYSGICLLLSFCSCTETNKNNPDGSNGKSENDIDAARNFIRNALDGSFDKARTFMLQDSSNNQFMDAVERSYEKMVPDAINSYRGASINIHQVTPVNDSTTIIIYSNSFKNDHDTLKVIKTKEQWLIDLKYLYEHDIDTIFNKPEKRDSLK